MELAELILTTSSIFAVGGIGLLGVWALPWSEPELDASSRAFESAGTAVTQQAASLLGRGARAQRVLATV